MLLLLLLLVLLLLLLLLLVLVLLLLVLLLLLLLLLHLEGRHEGVAVQGHCRAQKTKRFQSTQAIACSRHQEREARFLDSMHDDNAFSDCSLFSLLAYQWPWRTLGERLRSQPQRRRRSGHQA